MIHKIYINDEQETNDTYYRVYAYSIYNCETNKTLAQSIEKPEHYPAVLVFNWDEKGDVHSLDYEYVYLKDFQY
jgi:hypothetical protein